jgi:membrane protein CcdC involved in cytochrome C biogenesis
MFAIPLIFLAFAGVKIDWPDIDMTALVGYLFLAAFLVQLAWRVYVDYVKKRP